MQNNRWFQALIILLVIIASGWIAGQVLTLLVQFSNIILLFFISWLLAFTLSPIARWLISRGFAKILAVVVVYTGLALVFVIAGLLLIPAITAQVSDLINHYNVYSDNILRLVEQVQQQLLSWGVTEVNLNQFYNNLANQVQGVALTVLQNTIVVLQSVATLALQVVLVFLLSFYFLNDGERIGEGVVSLLPPTWRDEVRLVALSITKSFGGYIRGQVIFGLVYAGLTALVMVIPPFQLNFVVVASLVAGLCMLIPLIGNFLAYVPPMLVCLIDPNKASLWLGLLVALFIAQSIMMNVLGPRIMSSAIGIHPLYVVAALLIGGQMAGVWGALFGVPIAGAINLIGRPVMRRIRYQTSIYQEPAARQVTTTQFVTGPLAASLIESSEPERRTEEKASTTFHYPPPPEPARQHAAEPGSRPVSVPGPVLPVANPGAQSVSYGPSMMTGTPGQAGSSSSLGLPASATTPTTVHGPSNASPQTVSSSRAAPLRPEDLEDDIPDRGPTLTVRAWRLATYIGARAFSWARTRAQARASRN